MLEVNAQGSHEVQTRHVVAGAVDPVVLVQQELDVDPGHVAQVDPVQRPGFGQLEGARKRFSGADLERRARSEDQECRGENEQDSRRRWSFRLC